MENEYIIWHYERKDEEYKLPSEIATVEDICNTVFNMTTVQSCVLIIQQGSCPKVLVMSHMTHEEHKAVNKYLKQNIQIGLEFVLQKNVLRLPDTEPLKKKKPAEESNGQEDIQPAH